MPLPNAIPLLRARGREKQAALAARVGVTRQMLSRIEAGALPSLRRAVEIAAALGQPVERVFHGLVDDVLRKMAARSADAEIDSSSEPDPSSPPSRDPSSPSDG
jgi:DNA-binding XRE family transcriptional regulator